MRRLALSALTSLLVATPALAGPADAERLRELEREAQELRQKLGLPPRDDPGEKTFYVYCARADLERRLPSSPTDRTLLGMLSRLSVVGVDPVVDRRAPSQPIGYQVRPGCTFLAGDLITEVNGVALKEIDRAEQELKYTGEWRFKVQSRTYAQVAKHEPVPRTDARPFDLAGVLGLRESEAQLLPVFEGVQPKGFLARSVTPNGLMARAGLKEGDILLMVNGLKLTPDGGESVIRREWSSAGELAFTVDRAGQKVYLSALVNGSVRRR